MSLRVFSRHWAKALPLASLMLGASFVAAPAETRTNLVLDEPPKHVVAITGASVVVTLDGHADRLAATTERSKNTLFEGVLNEFFPDLNNLPDGVVGKDGTPNIEEMLSLEADLAVQWNWKEKSVAAIERAGIPVLPMEYTRTGMAESFLLEIGQVLEKTDKADRVLTWHSSALQRIKDAVATVAPQDKPSVLFLLRHNQAAGASSHFQYNMEFAGGTNALTTPGRSVEVDAEMILKANPDVIWLMGWTPQLTKEMFLDNPIYAEVSAVKNKRIYKVPVGGDHWDAPNQELPLSLEWFTRTLHPELLDGSIRDSILAGFPIVYGQTPSAEQMDDMLRVKANGDAAYYQTIVR